MELNNNNYYSKEANLEYMSSTQFKSFLDCEVEGLAKVREELVETKSDALLFGGYVDAYFSGELEEYKANNPDMFNSRTGELKAPFKLIGDVIRATEEDEWLMKALSGEKQKIMTGVIAGVPFKIKIDSYHKGHMIVDQKIIKGLYDENWVEGKGYQDFIMSYGYDIQGAIYQRIVEQNTGKKLPFVLAITTKEENPDKALIEIDQCYLDRALELVEGLAPRFDKIKKGLIEPMGCGKCPSCRKGKKVEGIVSYSSFFHKPSKLGDEE